VELFQRAVPILDANMKPTGQFVFYDSGFTDAQYQTLRELIRGLRQRRPVSGPDVVYHSAIQADRYDPQQIVNAKLQEIPSCESGPDDGAKSSDLVWSTSAPGVATIDAATGVVTGVAPGSADITVKSGDKSQTVRISIQPNGSGESGGEGPPGGPPPVDENGEGDLFFVNPIGCGATITRLCNQVSLSARVHVQTTPSDPNGFRGPQAGCHWTWSGQIFGGPPFGTISCDATFYSNAPFDATGAAHGTGSVTVTSGTKTQTIGITISIEPAPISPE
jgi:hypothetical protein